MTTTITLNIDIDFKLPDFIDFYLKNYEEDNLISSIQRSIDDITNESITKEIVFYLYDHIQDDYENILVDYIKSITPIFQSLDTDSIFSVEPDDRFYTYDELETELESRDWSKLVLEVKKAKLEETLQEVEVLSSNLK